MVYVLCTVANKGPFRSQGARHSRGLCLDRQPDYVEAESQVRNCVFLDYCCLLIRSLGTISVSMPSINIEHNDLAHIPSSQNRSLAPMADDGSVGWWRAGLGGGMLYMGLHEGPGIETIHRDQSWMRRQRRNWAQQN